MGQPDVPSDAAAQYQDEQEQVAPDTDCQKAAVHSLFDHLIDCTPGQHQQYQRNPEGGYPEVKRGKSHGGIAQRRKHEVSRDDR